jgi:hypothetical protein
MLPDGASKRVLENWIRREAVLKSTVRQAGLFTTSNDFNDRAAGAGHTTEIQYFNPLSGDSVVGSDNVDDKIPAGVLTGGNLQAVRQIRNKAWAGALLASLVSGNDIMASIAGGVAEWRALDEQKVALAMLAGVAADAAANDAETMVKDGAGKLTNALLIAAAQRKGELKGSLSTLVVHSAVHAQLAIDNLITTVPASDQSPSFDVYAGKRLVISDAMPVVDGVYTSLLCAPGIIAYGEAVPVNGAIETSYDPAAGMGSGAETLYTRRHYIMGVNGYSYTGTGNPNNTALMDQANYVRKYDAKQIPLVFIKSEIDFE